MKPSFKLLAFALGAGLAFTAPSAAHAQVSVGVQIGAPAWGPPVQQGTQYYYIPEIDGYYDIYNQMYIVFDGQQWVSMPYLDGYDPYYFHPYPVSYVGAQPWLYINTYRRYYPQYVVGWRRGGLGNAGRYYNHDYGAGRVYGYDHPRAIYSRPGGYPNRPAAPGNNGGFGHPGYNNYPNGGDHRGGQPGGNLGGQPAQQPPRGGFPGGGQPGGGNHGGGGGFQGGGNHEGGRRGGR